MWQTYHGRWTLGTAPRASFRIWLHVLCALGTVACAHAGCTLVKRAGPRTPHPARHDTRSSIADSKHALSAGRLQAATCLYKHPHYADLVAFART